MPNLLSTRYKKRSLKPKAGHEFSGSGADMKARLFLCVACLWPLWILALYGASAPPVDHSHNLPAVVKEQSKLTNLRNVLDRVDIMGYGPTHPRVAVVLVGDDREAIVRSVESVIKNTDLNRLFLICVIMDGHSEDEALIEELKLLDSGSVPHWHGLRPDIHVAGKGGVEEHTQKIHVLFNPKKRGLAASRLDAVEFIELLQNKHEQAGLKNTQEDLLLLLLQSGALLVDNKWLKTVTSSLIVPPPILPHTEENENIAMKLANAVSLRAEQAGKRTSFDHTLQQLENEPTAEDLNLSSGQTYPSPALNGAALVLRLNTFLNLPAQDPNLQDQWAANLDLSLNLWLCGDGIDIVHDANVVASPISPPSKALSPELAARLAAVWMDDFMQKKFLAAYSPETTLLDWETKLRNAKQSPTFPKSIPTRCRSFSWYIKYVNNDLTKILEQHEREPEEAQVVKQKLAQQVGGQPQPVAGERKKPSKSLSKTNLKIVQKATPIDIGYIDVSGSHKEHPHMGAKDVDGNWGYVHDAKTLYNDPPKFAFSSHSQEEKHMCATKDMNWKMMTQRIKLAPNSLKKGNIIKRNKIFCLVYTIESGHKKIPAIRETWGSKCDGFMVGSTKTDPSIGAVEIPHEGKEEYDNIWQKVRSMWSYIYDNYYEDYDWFHIGGDDLFLIVENLRYYLESEEIQTASNGGIYLPGGTDNKQTPLLLGRRFAYLGDMDQIFDSGGSGYTMNKAALKTLVVHGFPNYFPHLKTFSEDTMVARIFKKLGVLPYDTKDGDGGERYMPFMPGHHWGYRLPENRKKDWYANYSIDIKEGPEHCSPYSVAFHYVKGNDMKRLFALAYDLCSVEYK